MASEYTYDAVHCTSAEYAEMVRNGTVDENTAYYIQDDDDYLISPPFTFESF